MNRYKLILLLLVVATTVMSCSQSGSTTGELVGVRGGKWFEPVPAGMNFIRRGSIDVGPSDEDPMAGITPKKTVSIDAFWMDDTEITNSEYRQFTNWVRDSIARKLLAESSSEMAENYRNYVYDSEGNPTEEYYLNWREDIDWSDTLSLEGILMPAEDRFFRRQEIDSRKLYYAYTWVDYQKAAQREFSYDYANQQYKDGASRSELFVKKRQVHIYPDTLCWIRDFTYAYNEPWTLKYNWHPGFDDYPVVGISWEQASAFCMWRTQIQDAYFERIGAATVQNYRLPTEYEWEMAARGGLLNSKYPWGGYYSRNQQGVFMANFKALRGDYIEDGGLVTMRVGSFLPNDYGLYDMSGNVSEWTSTAYDEISTAMINELNPDFKYDAEDDDPPAMKRKVLKGGSWKDVSLFINVSSRDYEYQDTSRCYIGFRCVRSSFGSDFK